MWSIAFQVQGATLTEQREPISVHAGRPHKERENTSYLFKVLMGK